MKQHLARSKFATRIASACSAASDTQMLQNDGTAFVLAPSRFLLGLQSFSVQEIPPSSLPYELVQQQLRFYPHVDGVCPQLWKSAADSTHAPSSTAALWCRTHARALHPPYPSMSSPGQVNVTEKKKAKCYVDSISQFANSAAHNTADVNCDGVPAEWLLDKGECPMQVVEKLESSGLISQVEIPPMRRAEEETAPGGETEGKHIPLARHAHVAEPAYHEVVSRFQKVKKIRHAHLCSYTHLLRKGQRFYLVSEFWSLSLNDVINRQLLLREQQIQQRPGVAKPSEAESPSKKRVVYRSIERDGDSATKPSPALSRSVSAYATLPQEKKIVLGGRDRLIYCHRVTAATVCNSGESFSRQEACKGWSSPDTGRSIDRKNTIEFAKAPCWRRQRLTQARKPSLLLPEEFLRRVAHQTLSALSFLNSNGIMHGRLCPSCIRFDADGNVRLAEWGLHHLTRYGCISPYTQLVCPPPFLAPEMLYSGSAATAAFSKNFPNSMDLGGSWPCCSSSDVFALGVILLHGLQGPPRTFLPDRFFFIKLRKRIERRLLMKQRLLPRVVRSPSKEEHWSYSRQKKQGSDTNQQKQHWDNLRNKAHALDRAAAEVLKNCGAADKFSTVSGTILSNENSESYGAWDDWEGCESILNSCEGNSAKGENIAFSRLQSLRVLRCIDRAAFTLLFARCGQLSLQRTILNFSKAESGNVGCSIRGTLFESNQSAGEVSLSGGSGSARGQPREHGLLSTERRNQFVSFCFQSDLRRYLLLRQLPHLVQQLRHVLRAPGWLIGPDAYVLFLHTLVLSKPILHFIHQHEQEVRMNSSTMKQQHNSINRQHRESAGDSACNTTPLREPDEATFLANHSCRIIAAIAEELILEKVLTECITWLSGTRLWSGCHRRHKYTGSSLNAAFLQADSADAAWESESPLQVELFKEGVVRRDKKAGLHPAVHAETISEELRNFLHCCLCISSDERPSPSEARACDWLQQQSSKEQQPLQLHRICAHDMRKNACHQRIEGPAAASEEAAFKERRANAFANIDGEGISNATEQHPEQDKSMGVKSCVQLQNVTIEEVYFWWQLLGHDVHTALLARRALLQIPPLVRLPLASFPSAAVNTNFTCNTSASHPEQPQQLMQTSIGCLEKCNDGYCVSDAPHSANIRVQQLQTQQKRQQRRESVGFLTPFADLWGQQHNCSLTKDSVAVTHEVASEPEFCSCCGGRKRFQLRSQHKCNHDAGAALHSGPAAKQNRYGILKMLSNTYGGGIDAREILSGKLPEDTCGFAPQCGCEWCPEWNDADSAETDAPQTAATSTQKLDGGVAFYKDEVERCCFHACGLADEGRSAAHIRLVWTESDARVHGVNVEDTIAALKEADRYPLSYINEVRPRCVYRRQRHFLYQRLRVRLFRSLLAHLPKSFKILVKEAAQDVPPLLRPQIWAALLGVNFAAETAAGPFIFEQTIRDVQANSRASQLALGNILQCHAYHDLLSSSYGRKAIRQLLLALLVRASSRRWETIAGPYTQSCSYEQAVGEVLPKAHCVFFAQGLNAIAAPLLVLYENHPQIALSCLEQLLLQHSRYTFFYVLGGVGRSLESAAAAIGAASLQQQLNSFNQLIAFVDPSLANHLTTRLGLKPEVYALSWMLTLFSQAFELSQLYMLWDAFLLRPPGFVLFVAVCLLHCSRVPLLQLDTDEESSALSLLQSAIAFVHVPVLCAAATALQEALPFSIWEPFLPFKDVRSLHPTDNSGASQSVGMHAVVSTEKTSQNIEKPGLATDGEVCDHTVFPGGIQEICDCLISVNCDSLALSGGKFTESWKSQARRVGRSNGSTQVTKNFYIGESVCVDRKATNKQEHEESLKRGSKPHYIAHRPLPNWGSAGVESNWNCAGELTGKQMEREGGRNGDKCCHTPHEEHEEHTAGYLLEKSSRNSSYQRFRHHSNTAENADSAGIMSKVELCDRARPIMKAIIKGPALLLIGSPRKRGIRRELAQKIRAENNNLLPREAVKKLHTKYEEKILDFTSSGYSLLRPREDRNRNSPLFGGAASQDLEVSNVRESEKKYVDSLSVLDEKEGSSVWRPPLLSVQDLLLYREMATVLDTRSAACFAQSHFTGAKNVCVPSSTAALASLLAPAAAAAHAAGVAFPAIFEKCGGRIARPVSCDFQALQSGRASTDGQNRNVRCRSSREDGGGRHKCAAESCMASDLVTSITEVWGRGIPEKKSNFSTSSHTLRGREREIKPPPPRGSCFPLTYGALMVNREMSPTNETRQHRSDLHLALGKTVQPQKPWLSQRLRQMHLIVIVGNEDETSLHLASTLRMYGVPYVCVLKGGMNALLQHVPHTLITTQASL